MNIGICQVNLMLETKSHSKISLINCWIKL